MLPVPPMDPPSDSADDHRAALETTLAGDETEAVGAEAIDSTVALTRGAHLGRYTVLERIGSGGMGVVYGAFDPQLDRKVALKVMHPDLRGQTSGGRGRARLLREAQAMAKLSHPNVITVHDVGTFGARVFVAMEFIDGATIRDWLHQQHREWAEIIETFVRAGRGLAAAHTVGLVHRDFKPDNVLVGHDGRVLVMDFGLARTSGGPRQATGELQRPPAGADLSTTKNLGPKRHELHESAAIDPVADTHSGRSIPDTPEPSGDKSPADHELTRSGALLGTPAYMAPEQHKGSKPDPHADQFSFCVALYEALYGERPFKGNSITSLAMNVLDGDVRSAPKNSGIPSWLRDVVVRGLATEPTDRWPSIDALLAELQRDPEVKRAPWVAIGAALGVGGLITAAYIATRPPVDDRCAAAAAGSQVWDEATRNGAKAALTQTELPHAEVIAQSVDTALEAWAGQWRETYLDVCRANLRPAPRGPAPEEVPGLVCLQKASERVAALTRALQVSDAAAVLHAPFAIEALPSIEHCREGGELVESDMNVTTRQAEVRGELAVAEALLSLGRADQALERAEGLASAAHALGDMGLQALVLRVRALAMREQGRSRNAEGVLERAVILASAAKMPRLESALWTDLADLVGHRNDRRREGLRIALAADAALERAGNAPEASARLEIVRGRIAAAAGRYDEAAESFSDALALLSASGVRDGLWVAETLSALGQAQEGLGHFDAAIQTHSQALEERERHVGSQHPLVGLSLGQLGTAQLGADHLRKADASFVRAQWVFDAPLGSDTQAAQDVVHAHAHRDLASVEDSIGLLHRAREEFEAAEAAHRRSLALLGKGDVPADHRDLGYPLNNLGLALADQGRSLDALTPLRRAAKIWSSALPLSHPDRAVAHLNVANSLWALGQFVEAKMEYEIALDVWERALPPDHPLLAYALTGIGRCALAKGDALTAVDRLERALTIRDRKNEDQLNLAETALVLGRALWADAKDPTRARELIIRARDLVGAYEPSDAEGIDRLLDGAEVARFTDQLNPAGLGTSNRNPATYR